MGNHKGQPEKRLHRGEKLQKSTLIHTLFRTLGAVVRTGD